MTFARRGGTLPLMATALLAAGCATTGARRTTPPAAPVADPAAWLQSRQAFELTGRVAGAVDGEGFNAQLQLRQRGADSQLELRSPLGFGSATVHTDGQHLDYRSSRGERLSGEAGLAALTARLGFEPPLASLRYWLLGVPDPSPQAGAVTSDGEAFEQRGWRVSINEKTTASTPAGVVGVPRRLTLERAPVRLRVVVESWKLDR